MGRLLRVGLNRGLLGGNRFFTALGVMAAAFRILQKLAGTAPKTLYTHKLEKGQVLVITDTDRKEK